MLTFVEQYIDPNKNILDIGSNIGVHSVVYSNYLNNGAVYAFEPQPVVYELLCQNIKVNNCNNVIAYNFGASNKHDQFYMNADYNYKQNQGAFRICDNESTSSGIMIECKPVDDLNIKNVGYVKIDVEGHEYETLLGMKRLLARDLPVMIIEIHDSSPTKKEVITFLEEIGYTEYMRLSHCDYLFK